MSNNSFNRTCGSCGAPVDTASVTCPRCGALLAAYEAPAGSQAAIDPPVPMDIAPISPAVDEPSSTHLSRQPAPTTSLPEVNEPGPEPAHPTPRNVATAPATAPPISLASSRKKAQPVPPRAKPASRAEKRPAPPPAREIVARQPAAPARQPTTREIASTASSLGKLALGILMVLVVMGILDLDLIPILVLGVVMLSLLGIMRSAAKASGRKTTSMYDPKRRNRR